jgi:ATP:cob(I)alamin adenosyltransferase
VEDLHRVAVAAGDETYVDPSTGLTVFTELAHRRRGRCCGSRCRHCPYHDWTARDHNLYGSDGEEWAEAAAADRGRPSSSPDEPAVTCNGTPARLLKSPSSAAEAATDSDKKPPGPEARRKKNVPYTRTGDGGTSQLMTGERRSKGSAVFEALGTVDELCASVGLAHAMVVAAAVAGGGIDAPRPSPEQQDSSTDLEESLVQVMSRLFDIGAHIAMPRKPAARSGGGGDDGDSGGSDSEASRRGGSMAGGGFDESHVEQLERWIDAMTDDLPELRSFILPSGSVASAQLHVARCVCRRAERAVVQLVQEEEEGQKGAVACDPAAVRYLNRLSDYLFVAARWVNAREGGEEILYKKPTRASAQRVAVVREKP